MPETQKSNCCKASFGVASGDEGTNYYQCGKCGKACDPVTENSNELGENLVGHICTTGDACEKCEFRLLLRSLCP